MKHLLVNSINLLEQFSASSRLVQVQSRSNLILLGFLLEKQGKPGGYSLGVEVLLMVLRRLIFSLDVLHKILDVVFIINDMIDEKSKNLMVIFASFGVSKEKPCEIRN